MNLGGFLFIKLEEKTCRYSEGSYSSTGFYSSACLLVSDRLRNAASSISFVFLVTIEHMQHTAKHKHFLLFFFPWQFSEFDILELK